MTVVTKQDIFDARAADKKNTSKTGPSGEITSGRRWYLASNVINSMLVYGAYPPYPFNDNKGTKNAVYFYYQYAPNVFNHYIIYTNGNVKMKQSTTKDMIYADVNQTSYILKNIYDDLQDMRIPCDSYGWFTNAELHQITSEDLTGNVTGRQTNMDTFTQIALVDYSSITASTNFKKPSQLPEPPVFSQQVLDPVAYYQTRRDYSTNGGMEGNNEYFYPSPPFDLSTMGTYYNDDNGLIMSYPYGAFSYYQYQNNPALLKDFDVSWITYSANDLNYVGEGDDKTTYTNTYIIKKDSGLFINGSSVTLQDTKALAIPFNAVGLLWRNEYIGMSKSSGGPDATLFKSLTGVDLSSYNPDIYNTNGDGGDSGDGDGTVTVGGTCKSVDGIFRDRLYADQTRIYEYKDNTFKQVVPASSATYTTDSSPTYYYQMADIYNKVDVYNNLYFYNPNSSGYQYIKIDVKGYVYVNVTGTEVKPIDYPTLIYTASQGNIFDPASQWYMNKFYINFKFYGSLFAEETDYYVNNKACGTIFKRLTYADISVLNTLGSIKQISNTDGFGSTTPIDDGTGTTPPDTTDPDVIPPVDTTDPDVIPPPVDTTSTDTTTTTTTTTTTDDTITASDISTADTSSVDTPTAAAQSSNVNNFSNVDPNTKIFLGLAALAIIGIIVYSTSEQK